MFTDRARLADFVGTRPTFAAIYQPGDKLSLYAARFDWFCRLAWALKDAALVIEELADVTAPNRAPDSWSAITRKGGNVGTWISAIAATQRPAEIDKTFLGNCTLVHCGRLNDEGAIVTMRRTLGVTYEDIAGLRDLEFIERNMNTGAVRRGVISLVT